MARSVADGFFDEQAHHHLACHRHPLHIVARRRLGAGRQRRLSVCSRRGASPRLPIAIFAPVIIGLFFLLRSKSIAAFLDATPAPWLIALQVYRIFGGIFLVNWMHGTAAGIFAVPAGIGDMLTGIMALPVALLLASGSERGRSAAMAWNIFGLLDLAVAVTLGTLSSPGPFQIFGLDIPASLAGTYPTVLIPAFAVPSSILLHALSIRQLRRIGRRAE
jgi:hypothetical protein